MWPLFCLGLGRQQRGGAQTGPGWGDFRSAPSLCRPFRGALVGRGLSPLWMGAALRCPPLCCPPFCLRFRGILVSSLRSGPGNGGLRPRGVGARISFPCMRQSRNAQRCAFILIQTDTRGLLPGPGMLRVPKERTRVTIRRLPVICLSQSRKLLTPLSASPNLKWKGPVAICN